MFIETLLEGLSWGLFIVAVLIPVAVFSIVWHRFKHILKPETITEMLEEMPELPLNEEQPPTPTYKYTASTIVRPPNVIRLGEDKDEE